MKKATILLLTFWLFIGLYSCSDRQPDRRLVAAEQLIDTRYDSAYMILDSIDPTTLKKDRDRALFGLLMTQASDRNHLDPTNDTLIDIAVDYFDRSDEILNRVKALYYQGRVYYLKGNHSLAILSYMKAKENADGAGIDFWAGMACRGMADIYNDRFNSAEALNFARQEYNLTKRSGVQPYINYAYYDLARSYHNDHDCDKAIEICTNLLDSALKTRDSLLYYYALELKARAFLKAHNYSSAYPLYKKVCELTYATAEDSLFFSNVLYETSHAKESIELLNKVADTHVPTKNFIKYKIAKREGRYKDAVCESDYIDSVLDVKLKTAMSHDLTSSLTDYFELTNKLNKTEIKSAQTTIWVICLSALLLILIAGWIIYFINIRKKREINDKIVLAQQLQESLEVSRTHNTKANNIIQTLLSTKYEMLENLSEIVLTNSESKVARRKIADSVTKLIDDLSIRSEKIENLEREVDESQNNIITDFKKDLPGLKDEDYRLFLFSVLQFSNATIMLLLKAGNIGSVYNRKKRLKDKIKQLDTEKSERYLKYFN